jgi:hypothetical protein
MLVVLAQERKITEVTKVIVVEVVARIVTGVSQSLVVGRSHERQIREVHGAIIVEIDTY